MPIRFTPCGLHVIIMWHCTIANYCCACAWYAKMVGCHDNHMTSLRIYNEEKFAYYNLALVGKNVHACTFWSYSCFICILSAFIGNFLLNNGVDKWTIWIMGKFKGIFGPGLIITLELYRSFKLLKQTSISAYSYHNPGSNHWPSYLEACISYGNLIHTIICCPNNSLF